MATAERGVAGAREAQNETERPTYRPIRRIDAQAGRIVELRDRGWTQKRIAEELGISQSSVVRILTKMGRTQPHIGRAAPRRRPVRSRPTHGRPYDVLRYIDCCLEENRPLLFDLCGGPGEVWRVLREAEARLWAAQERLTYQREVVDAQQRLVKALGDLEALGVS